MSQYPMSVGILRCRNELDDTYWGKYIFRFQPLQGNQDGNNQFFQIPQQRIVAWDPTTWSSLGSIPYPGPTPVVPQVYKNNTPMNYGTDYILLDPHGGVLQFQNQTQPVQSDSVDCSFYYTWFDDGELDSHLDHAAAEVGFSAYYTFQDVMTPGIIPVPSGIAPTDIPDALFSAAIMLGSAFAARALSLRFSTRYDTSAGDQSFSPSQMATAYSKLADTLEKQGYTARDDFYKGQSRQYSPAIGVSFSSVGAGWVLPNWIPPR